MSRSYKKHPIITDHSVKITKWKKRLANKKVRNTKDIPKNKGYKKIYDSWDICDYTISYTWNEYLIAEEELEGRTLTSEEVKILRNKWEKYYKRK